MWEKSPVEASRQIFVTFYISLIQKRQKGQISPVSVGFVVLWHILLWQHIGTGQMLWPLIWPDQQSGEQLPYSDSYLPAPGLPVCSHWSGNPGGKQVSFKKPVFLSGACNYVIYSLPFFFPPLHLLDSLPTSIFSDILKSEAG